MGLGPAFGFGGTVGLGATVGLGDGLDFGATVGLGDDFFGAVVVVVDLGAGLVVVFAVLVPLLEYG